jgi:hypothetical protein
MPLSPTDKARLKRCARHVAYIQRLTAAANQVRKARQEMQTYERQLAASLAEASLRGSESGRDALRIIDAMPQFTLGVDIEGPGDRSHGDGRLRVLGVGRRGGGRPPCRMSLPSFMAGVVTKSEGNRWVMTDNQRLIAESDPDACFICDTIDELEGRAAATAPVPYGGV